MTKDIYLFGNHIPRPNIGYRVVLDSVVAISAGCQLAIKGGNGDDEFKDFDPTPVVVTTYTPYGKINPYTVGFRIA